MKKSALYFGRNVFKEALEARAKISELFLETRSAYDFVKSCSGFREEDFKIEEGIPPQIKSEAHQGVAFRSTYEFYSTYDPEILRDFSFIVLCNHIEDVHNLGSIARCGAAFGARLLIHESTKSASITPAMVKYSAGCAFKMKFMSVPDLTTVVNSLSKRDYQIVGLDLGKNTVSLYDWKPKVPLALILGSEGQGIESGIKGKCDILLKIPMEKRIDSLNVSHAAGLAMSWAKHHRPSIAL